MARPAEAALAQRRFVTAIDVLVGVGWLEPHRVNEWRQGRVDYLERVTVANSGDISTAIHVFRRWAQARGLNPSETAYVARTRDRRPLRFSNSGDPEIEWAYRTHWVSPELSERKRARMTERQSRAPELVVISPVSDFTCSLGLVAFLIGAALIAAGGNPVPTQYWSTGSAISGALIGILAPTPKRISTPTQKPPGRARAALSEVAALLKDLWQNR